MGLIVWLIFGGLAGWIASKIMGTDAQQGILLNIVVGIVGAFIGGFIGNMITGRGLDGGVTLWSIVLAVLGSLLLLWIYRMTTRGRATRTL